MPMSLTIEQMREIVDALPVWTSENDGKEVELSGFGMTSL